MLTEIIIVVELKRWDEKLWEFIGNLLKTNYVYLYVEVVRSKPYYFLEF